MMIPELSEKKARATGASTIFYRPS